MKIIKALLIAAAPMLTLASCNISYNTSGNTVKASKNYVTKEIKIEPYTHIKLTGSPDVVFSQKPGNPHLEIHTSDNIVDLLDIHVEGETLYIGFKKGVSVSYNELTIHTSSPNLNQVSVTGSGEVEITDKLNTEELTLRVTGSGDIFAEQTTCNQCHLSVTGSGDISLQKLTANTVRASVTGSGDITLQGNAQNALYEVAGSGDLSATELRTKNVTAKVTGSGDIRCHASEELKAHVTGSGDIGYKGNPTIPTAKKGVYKL